jgi:pyruvate,orthophosphate dikinase
VAGLVYTLPVSEHQNRELPVPRETTLESAFPGIYAALRTKAEELVRRRGYSHQEIEFTFESGRAEDLYILQSRKYAPSRTDSVPVFMGPDLGAARVGSGMGIGGGAMNGIAVFTREDLERFAGDKQTLILIRPDTVPDTIDMIFRCDGLLTARGGITSHAAVTAVNLGKTCVVNCQDLRFDTPGRGCSIGEARFEAGDPIGIDGQSGCIYRGNHPIGAEEHLG